MSVIMQKPENTAALADFLAKLLNNGKFYFEMEPDSRLKDVFADCRDGYDPQIYHIHLGDFDASKIYTKLVIMNQRAKSDKSEIVPYKEHVVCGRTGYIYETKNSKGEVVETAHFRIDNWHFQIYKMLSFYNMQCKIYALYDDPLCIELAKLENQLGDFILRNSKQYNRIKWE